MLLKKPLTEEELKQKLEHFKKTISGILSQPYVVTASIGGCVFSDLQNRDKLMEKADAALYAAKKNGRDGYVLKRLMKIKRKKRVQLFLQYRFSVMILSLLSHEPS